MTREETKQLSINLHGIPEGAPREPHQHFMVDDLGHALTFYVNGEGMVEISEEMIISFMNGRGFILTTEKIFKQTQQNLNKNV